jgi:hypothetical protein
MRPKTLLFYKQRQLQQKMCWPQELGAESGGRGPHQSGFGFGKDQGDLLARAAPCKEKSKTFLHPDVYANQQEEVDPSKQVGDGSRYLGPGEQASGCVLRQAFKLRYTALSPPSPEQRKTLKRIFTQTFFKSTLGEKGSPTVSGEEEGTTPAPNTNKRLCGVKAPTPTGAEATQTWRSRLWLRREKRRDFAFFSGGVVWGEKGATFDVRLPSAKVGVRECSSGGEGRNPHQSVEKRPLPPSEGETANQLVGLAEDVRTLLKGVCLSATSSSSQKVKSTREGAFHSLGEGGSSIGSEAFRELLFSGFSVLEENQGRQRQDKSPIAIRSTGLHPRERSWGSFSDGGRSDGEETSPHGQVISFAHPSKLPQWIQAQNWESSFLALQRSYPPAKTNTGVAFGKGEKPNSFTRSDGEEPHWHSEGSAQERQTRAWADAARASCAGVPLSSSLTPALCRNSYQQVRTVFLMSVRSLFVCLLGAVK